MPKFKWQISNQAKMPKVSIKKHATSIFLTVILTAYFFFGFQHLGSFVTADEHYWVEERIPQYWEAWSEGKWKKTLINDKPGVSLALISGPALLFHDDTRLGCQEKDGWFSGCDPKETSALYASFRTPILLANAALLVLIFFSIRAFSGRFVAAAATGIMALSPNLLGMSQIVNPDSLLWSSGSAALFAFLAFLKSGRRSFALLTVAALTLAFLSKYTAIIIIFFLPFIVLAIRFLDPGFSRIPPKRKLASLFAISMSPLLLFPFFVPGVLSSGERITTFLTAGTGSFLPWVGYATLLGGLAATIFFRIPKRIETGIRFLSDYSLRVLAGILIAFMLVLVLGRIFFPTWDIFTAIPFDIKDLTNSKYYLAEPLSPTDTAFIELSPFVYGLPIATFLFSIFAIGFTAISRKRDGLPLTLILVLFIILHLAALGFSNVFAIPRYIILTFPIASFLAALGIKEIWWLVPKRLQTHRILATFITVVTIVTLGSILSSKPYYTNFANAFLPKDALISHSWGYGGYEAAQYLNALPDAKNLTVWSDYYGVCEFFVGRCLTAYTFDPEIAPDYYVLTRRGQLRYMSKYDRWEEKSGLTAYRYYDRSDPVFEISINGKSPNFVKVFKVDNELRTSIITDIDHCPSREAAPQDALDRFVAFADTRDSDFTISLGDNISHRLRDCSKHAHEDLPFIVDSLERTESPNYWVLGDHDIASGKESYDFWLETTRQERAYRSFDAKNVHVVILDTVTGGEPLVKSCEESPSCASVLSEKTRINKLIRDSKMLEATIEESGKSRADILKERTMIAKRYQEELSIIRSVRDATDRDRGMVLDRELAWLKEDLAETKRDRVLVFSDHPLFPFAPGGKSYDIVNGGNVRSILKESGKTVVAISGEAHRWHEEELDGIRFFIIDQFKSHAGSWAFFSWGKDKEPALERIAGTESR